MAKSRTVECEVEYTDVEFKGRNIPGVRVNCTRCDNSAEAGGQEEKSVRRCLVELRETCPRHEYNYYVCPDED